MSDDAIRHVSDTALWVAACRAMESERADALFRDPLAARLAGDRGHAIARSMPDAAATIWSVAIRTCVIDDLLPSALASGVDTILNLGAGLDTRPYRLDLPAATRWIEVDHRELIEVKEAQLRDEVPACPVERVGLDLADRDGRLRLFARIDAAAARVLVLTEGVVPYLTVEDAASLASDLHAEPSFARWVSDYFAAALLRRLKDRPSMRNAPMRFDPPDWEGFFASLGWRLGEMRYLGEESLRLGRRVPMPLAVKLLRPVTPRAQRRAMLRMTGYAALERVATEV